MVEEEKKTKSKFIRVKCQDCGGEESGQIIFSHPSTVVTCNVCGATLIKPQGGKGKIRGEILGVVE
ncbi:MAG: 30S ribosomal protein S27e [Thermoplasmata archaeon]|nr:MAG: 30S ribosomal protein S27e [Thermoplasmata archaeon]